MSDYNCNKPMSYECFSTEPNSSQALTTRIQKRTAIPKRNGKCRLLIAHRILHSFKVSRFFWETPGCCVNFMFSRSPVSDKNLPLSDAFYERYRNKAAMYSERELYDVCESFCILFTKHYTLEMIIIVGAV